MSVCVFELSYLDQFYSYTRAIQCYPTRVQFFKEFKKKFLSFQVLKKSFLKVSICLITIVIAKNVKLAPPLLNFQDFNKVH